MDKEIEREILERLVRIETKIDDFDSVRTKANEAYTNGKENEKRIDEIEDKIKWLSRTIVGAILTCLVSLIFIFIKLGLGLGGS